MFYLIQRFKNIYHLFTAVIASIYYRFPSRRLMLIGVTGTDGKTTTASLIYHILKENSKKVSMISTVKTIIGDKETDIGLHTTTPSSFLIQKLLKKAALDHDQYFILETTSHAIDQNRVYGIQFEISVLTNITHEHLDYHPSFDHYLMTKAKLFLNSNKSVINADDNSYEKIKTILEENNKKYYTYGLKNKADFNLNISDELDDFNNYNFLAAYSVASVLGLKTEQILSAIKSFKLPKGRMNIVYDKEFKVIVDFAHTPNAIEQVLKSIKEKHIKNNGRIIHIFGAPGLRDKEKRPIMGKKSAKYADMIILTSDDYRSENPEKICQEIAKGILLKQFKEIPVGTYCNTSLQNKTFTTIINRREAIKKAISIAKNDDVVIITGIGHQQSLAQGAKEIPWDEEAVVLDSLSSRVPI